MANLKKLSIPRHTRHLGIGLFAYILNIDDEQAASLLEGGGLLTSQQKATLDKMETVLIQVKKDRTRNQVLQSSDAERLSELTDSNGHSIFNSLRKINGGVLSLSKYDDPVKKVLSEMCVECFPATLIPRVHDEFNVGRIRFPLFRGTALFKNFLSAILLDVDLMNLFPDGINNELESSRRFVTSFGSGRSVQACHLHENILMSAVALMHSRMESSIFLPK